MRHAQSDIHQDRLQNNRGNFAWILFEAALDRGQVIEGRDENVRHRRFRDPKPARHGSRSVDVAVVRSVWLHADQGAVVQSVIRAFELHDLVASSSGAGKTNGMHGRFRPAVAKPAHLNRKPVANFLCQFPFHVVRHAKHGSGCKPLLDRLHHRRMAMSRHQRTER